MKKPFIALFIFSFIFVTTSVFASSVIIDDKSVKGASSTLQITGVIPVVKNLSNIDFEKKVNLEVESVYESCVQSALKNSSKSIDFSYKTIFNKDDAKDNNIYLVVHDTKTSGTTMEKVSTINFDAGKNTFVTIESVMGSNAVKLVNKFVSEEIKKNPDEYNPDFNEISSNPDFYVENNVVNLLFDEYEIAPGSKNIVTLQMELSKIHNSYIKKADYYLKSGYKLKMIPLRLACEGGGDNGSLGYDVVWDNKTKTVIVSRDGFKTSLNPGQNKYLLSNGTTRELESAPEIQNGILYVPISFFEVILGTTYSSDFSENIDFSQYF